MYTFIVRAQRASQSFSTAASVVALFVALLGVLQLYFAGAFGLSYDVGAVEPKMRWHNTRRFGSVDGHPKENARFTFDLEADLTPLFNWNTKQVFVYVTADYTTVSKKTGVESANSVVIWDKIIPDVDHAHLSLHSQYGKYSVYDIQSEFGGPDRAVKLTLRWNVQPRLGFLARGQAVASGDNLFDLPEQVRLKSKSSSGAN